LLKASSAAEIKSGEKRRKPKGIGDTNFNDKIPGPMIAGEKRRKPKGIGDIGSNRRVQL